MEKILKSICISCSCNEVEAQEYLDDEIRYLKDLQNDNDLEFEDLEITCKNLGIDNDYIQYFIDRLAG